MKRLYYIFILCLIGTITQAQLDTVLIETFQTNPFANMDTSVTGSNMNWVNYDQDGLTPQFGGDINKKWYWGEFFTNPIDPTTGETNYIATSLSFLEGSLPGNRNWLVLPPIEITDASYMLHWESAPNQMPRYMDGYAVLLSTGGNNVSTDFTETLFEAASMDAITGNGQSIDFSNFSFTNGYQHADGGTLSDYFVDNGGTVLNGLLEPHSVSLEAYVGQTVYIAFLHDSDDDERLGLDDIMITKNDPSNTNKTAINNLRMECYPNPAQYRMNLNFRLNHKSLVNYQVLNSAGQLIQSQNLGELATGNHSVKLTLNDMPSGNYLVHLQVGETIAARVFVKH